MSHRVSGKLVIACAAAAATFSASSIAAMASPPGSQKAKKASASASASATCPIPTLVQPFLPLDTNLYALAPGESADNFAGTDWLLLGGAGIVSTTLSDGTTGDVLGLPAGAIAISPPMCITDQYPSARAIVRAVSGTAGATLDVAYISGKSLSLSSGTVTGASSTWSLGPVVSLAPSTTSGAQLAVFTFVGGTGSDSQLYDFYVDPRQRH